MIPKENERDLAEIPDNIKKHLDIRPVRWIDEVLEVALQYMPEAEKSAENTAEKKEGIESTENPSVQTH